MPFHRTPIYWIPNGVRYISYAPMTRRCVTLFVLKLWPDISWVNCITLDVVMGEIITWQDHWFLQLVDWAAKHIGIPKKHCAGTS